MTGEHATIEPPRYLLLYALGHLSLQAFCTSVRLPSLTLPSLNLICIFLQCAGRPLADLCSELVKSLAGMREIDNFPHLAEVDNAVGAAVKTLGPRAVLAVVSLLIEGEET